MLEQLRKRNLKIKKKFCRFDFDDDNILHSKENYLELAQNDLSKENTGRFEIKYGMH